MTTGIGTGIPKKLPRITPGHAAALDQLTSAIVKAAADGHSLPCGRYGNRGAWTSPDPAERATAARACAGCPVLVACDHAGRYETAGVWAGRDRETNR